MAQFVAFDPNVEVLGGVILATVQAMGEKAVAVLERYGLKDIEPDGWYLQQDWLDAFRELAAGDFSATLDLVSIGMNIPENATWPPGIETIEEAIQSIDEAYHINHRGGEIGEYRATQIGPREIEVVCRNPYPCDFDYGILYSVGRMYQPPDGHIRVASDDSAECRKDGADSCTYHVSW